MADPEQFLTGIDTLVTEHLDWFANRPLGLVAHPASVNAKGVPSAEFLRRLPDTRLRCLFGPEHGYFGSGSAGETIRTREHPGLRIPIHSLYGRTRKPTAEMLEDLDIIVFDLQDIGARAYTYVSTLRYVLEAAAKMGKTVIVCDRPIPLPRVVDGPMREPAFENFAGLIPSPLCYGMTPGETARWLKDELRLTLDLLISPMKGYRRDGVRGKDWPAFVPPSPAIVSWESATCFSCTVLLEALPAVDSGRQTERPFQRFGAPWIKGRDAARALSDLKLPGVRFAPDTYEIAVGAHEDRRVEGVRMEVTDRHRFRPVYTGVAILSVLQNLYGTQALWGHRNTRPEFFDKLAGTDSLRKALLENQPLADIAARWESTSGYFQTQRQKYLLYKEA